MEEQEIGNSEKGGIRTTLEAAVEKAKAVCERLQDQTVAAAKATDETIRERPYHAIGIAFAAGVLIGLLMARSRRD